VPVRDRANVAVVIYAVDIARVSDFYAAILHVEDLRREADHVVLETPGCQLVVLAIPASVAQDIVITSPPGRRTETPIKVSFPVESIAASRAMAGRLGGQIDSPPREWQFEGHTVCDGQDPEGNVLQLREWRPSGA
jgi:predicted enzyme related to lactoylglutathione lyase